MFQKPFPTCKVAALLSSIFAGVLFKKTEKLYLSCLASAITFSIILFGAKLVGEDVEEMFGKIKTEPFMELGVL
jgi:hypothetical protein